MKRDCEVLNEWMVQNLEVSPKKTMFLVLLLPIPWKDAQVETIAESIDVLRKKNGGVSLTRSVLRNTKFLSQWLSSGSTNFYEWFLNWTWPFLTLLCDFLFFISTNKSLNLHLKFGFGYWLSCDLVWFSQGFGFFADGRMITLAVGDGGLRRLFRQWNYELLIVNSTCWKSSSPLRNWKSLQNQ